MTPSCIRAGYDLNMLLKCVFVKPVGCTIILKLVSSDSPFGASHGFGRWKYLHMSNGPDYSRDSQEEREFVESTVR